jgi:hypothetical protein
MHHFVSGMTVLFCAHWDHPPAAKSINIHNAMPMGNESGRLQAAGVA